MNGQEARKWQKCARSGGVDFTLRAQQMGSAVFDYDPIIGCPFDASDMKMVQVCGKCVVGNMVTFRGMNRIGTMDFSTIRGRIIAIGENAKYLNGDTFVALAIQVGATINFKHGTEVQVL